MRDYLKLYAGLWLTIQLFFVILLKHQIGAELDSVCYSYSFADVLKLVTRRPC